MRILKSIALTGVLALAVVGSAEAWVPTTASQQFEQTKGMFYTGDVCAGVTSAIADQPLQIFADVYTQFSISNACTGFAKNTSAGDLAVKWELDHWEGGIIWLVCRDSDWKVNTGSTSYMSMSKQWDGSHPCGSGRYRARTRGKVHTDSGWHKGFRQTSSIYID
jgi:hypothetical protein